MLYEKYLSEIEMLKARLPEAEVTTDIIVGFPGETEQDFEDTLDLVRYCKYTGIFGFMYSKRSGTIAEKMDNQVPIAVKRERVNKLLALSKEIGKQVTESMVNTTVEVLMYNEKISLLEKQSVARL